MLEILILSFFISIVAFVYAVILVDDGMILFGYKKFLYKTIGKVDYLFKPVVGCPYCVSGQFALWLYLILYYDQGYNLLEHITLVSLSIFNIAIIKKFKIYE